LRLDFNQPGKPTQNGHLEGFNYTFRDECLNVHWFGCLADARHIIEDWRQNAKVCRHLYDATAYYLQAVVRARTSAPHERKR
jgi:hypothetical protein